MKKYYEINLEETDLVTNCSQLKLMAQDNRKSNCDDLSRF